jgi:hypothetical protein
MMITLPSCDQDDDVSLLQAPSHKYVYRRHDEKTSRDAFKSAFTSTQQLQPCAHYMPRSRGRPHAGGAMRDFDLSFRPSLLHHKPTWPESRPPHFRFIRPWTHSLQIAMRQQFLSKITPETSLTYLATTRFHQAQAPRQTQEPVSVAQSLPRQHTPHHQQSPHPAQVCSLSVAGIV